MQKSYLRLLLFLYALALILCTGCRGILAAHFIDRASGLYRGGEPLVLLFNGALLVFIALWFVLTLFRRTEHEYPLRFHSKAAGILSALCAVLILAATYADVTEVWNRIAHGIIPEYPFSFYLIRQPSPLRLALLGVKALTGLLSAAAMLLMGLRRSLGRWQALGFFPAVWMMISLLERYTTFMAPVAISDNLLLILFMIFAPLFLIGQARSICGYSPSTSRNYMIPAGFAASLTGFSAAITQIVYFVQDGGLSLYGWQPVFYAFVLLLSLHIAVYLFGLIRAIQIV